MIGLRTARTRGLLAGAGAALLLAAACDPYVDPLDESLGAKTLTPDGEDKYSITVDGDVTTAEAHATNTGGNLRVAFWRLDDTASVDQETCATWDNSDSDFQQPGAVLRLRHTEEEGWRLITITRNVWGHAYWVFNVHVWEDGTFEQIGAFDLSQTFLSDGEVVPYPWRMCARAVDDEVSFIAWPLTDPEPAWGDPDYGGSLTLPAGWEDPGVPGWFIGHLLPGESVDFLSMSTADLTP